MKTCYLFLKTYLPFPSLQNSFVFLYCHKSEKSHSIIIKIHTDSWRCTNPVFLFVELYLLLVWLSEWKVSFEHNKVCILAMMMKTWCRFLKTDLPHPSLQSSFVFLFDHKEWKLAFDHHKCAYRFSRTYLSRLVFTKLWYCHQSHSTTLKYKFMFLKIYLPFPFFRIP